MTDATVNGPWRAWPARGEAAPSRDTARPAPTPPGLGPPVLIGDAVTPLGDGTLLSLLLSPGRQGDVADDDPEDGGISSPEGSGRW